MIKHKENLTAAERQEIIDFCTLSCIGVKAITPLIAYGTEYDFAESWVQRENDAGDATVTAFISRFYGDVTVCATPTADRAELEMFLQTIGYSGLVSNIPFFDISVDGHIMCLEQGNACTAAVSNDKTQITENGSLKEFYELLSKNYPDNVFSRYEDWLVDLSHRVRHGVSETAVLRCDGENVATAAALSITDRAVLLGAISVNPNQRGRHFAHTLVKHFADKFRDRTVYIMCKPDKIGLYEKAGFKNIDEFYRK